MGSMAKEVIRVSDKEAASDFASLLARVREGAEVIIEHDARPVAVVRPQKSSGAAFFRSPSLWQKHTRKTWDTSQQWTRSSQPT